MGVALSEDELQALNYVASGLDAFTGCCASGDFGKRMRTLAALRRAGVIDHSNRLTELGRAVLRECGGSDGLLAATQGA